jgi:hypothetical protein
LSSAVRIDARVLAVLSQRDLVPAIGKQHSGVVVLRVRAPSCERSAAMFRGSARMSLDARELARLAAEGFAGYGERALLGLAGGWERGDVGEPGR